jgi:hypothetical protein
MRGIYRKREKECIGILCTMKEDYRANNGNIGGRPLAVQKAIRESVDLIVDDISSRKKEKNPIARSLLKIVDLIMSTEK